MKRLTIAVSLVLALCAAAASGDDRLHERGFPPIDIHFQREHNAGQQTFDIAQGRDGVLYFGNLDGVLTYDGAWWRVVALPQESAAYAVESDRDGRIAVGGIGQLGYIAAGDGGATVYRSLVPLLPPEAREFGEVSAICTSGSGFVFLTTRFLLGWDGTSARVITDLRAMPTPPTRCFRIDDRLYFGGDGGLRRLDEKTSSLIAAAFDGKSVDLMLPSNDGRALVAVRNEGLFELDRDDRATPAAPQISAWLKGKQVTAGCRLRDGRAAITTSQHGLLLLDTDGSAEILDHDAGLPEELLTGALADEEGSLWLSFYGPLVRVDVSAPVAILDSRRGLRGLTNTLARHRGDLLVATSHGLFAFGPRNAPGPAGTPGGARRIEGLDDGVWSLLPIGGDGLLIGTARGAFQMRGDGPPALIAGTERLVGYVLQQSVDDPNLVWMTTRGGLTMLRRDGDSWRFDGAVAGTPSYIRELREHDGALWGATVFNGIVRMNVDRVAKKAQVEQFGDGERSFLWLRDRLVMTTTDGKILHLTADGRIERDPQLGHIALPGNAFKLFEDERGNVWFNSAPPRMVARMSDGSFAKESVPLIAVEAVDVQDIFVDSEGPLWFTTDRGLYRYEPSAASQTHEQPQPLIRRVTVGDDQPLLETAPTLAHAFRRLRIEFAPASFRPGVDYQFRLDPIDAQWSAWSSAPFIDYTNLDAGHYTFRLRTRGVASVSDETRWSFTVRPPWYRSGWAWAVWALAAIGLVVLIVTLRTRGLRRQAERLRGLVAERTDELRQTVEQLRDAQEKLLHNNELLELANGRLERLSLLDELTGIANRRYFQRALVEDWERARERRLPLSMILLDLDHFKELNDSHGHSAGDACLRQVGTFLGQLIRRSGDLVSRGGDLVARYGGEEFAMLLMDTNGHEATLIAEMLRGGLERLQIVFEDQVLRVTASCGVASVEAHEGESATLLVERADRALYVAKRDGRNRVRYASEVAADAH